MTPIEVLQGRFEGGIGAWDRHVASCRVCLVQGQRMCSEGEFLTSDVDDHRAAYFQAVDARAHSASGSMGTPWWVLRVLGVGA